MVKALSCLSKGEPTAPETWASCLAYCATPAVTQGTGPLRFWTARQARLGMCTPHTTMCPLKTKTKVHLSYVCAFGQEMDVARFPRDEPSASDNGPSASTQGEFALGVADPLTKGISGPSRWRGQGWWCLMPRGATVLVLTARLWAPDPSQVSIFLCICSTKISEIKQLQSELSSG